MRNQGITVWVGFNADRMMKDQTNHTICRLYHRIIKYIKQVYLEIWHGKEWICFLVNLAPVFSPIYLFSLACTYFYLLGSFLICENLFLFMIVCENLVFFCLNLCENKAAYEPPSFKMYLLSSKHDNGIFLTSHVPILCFLLCEFFSFCFWLLFYKIKCLYIH